MNQTPPELLAPYKAAVVASARDLLRAAGTDGIAIEIPASVPPCVILLGAEDRVGQLLRAPVREPMVGGRRASDPPAPVLSFDEQAPGVAGLTPMQLSIAARHMCNRSADVCGVNRDDNWKIYGDDFIAELREALEIGIGQEGGAA